MEEVSTTHRLSTGDTTNNASPVAATATTTTATATAGAPSSVKDIARILVELERSSPETVNSERSEASSRKAENIQHAHEKTTMMAISVPTKEKVVPIWKPDEHDIIKGRGGAVNKHAGNIRFRSWVDERKKRYAMSRVKAEKVRIAQEVIDLVKGLSPPGRFLKMGGPPANYWVEMDAETTLTKVSQALREGAPIIRQAEKNEQDDHPFPSKQQQPNVVFTKQPNVVAAKPLTLPALGQQRTNALLVSSMKRPQNTLYPLPPIAPKPQALPTVDEKSNQKRRMHPGSEMSPSAVAEQQQSVRLQVLQQQQQEEEEEQERSSKRSKPNPNTDRAGAAAAAVVPGSPMQQEQGYASPEDQHQNRPAAARGKNGLPRAHTGANGRDPSRKRSASKTRMDNGAIANVNKNVPTPTSFLILRLDQLEERQGDLESQLLEEKKQRLKQEQRQGALELQLLEAKTMRMKQDDVIKSLHREIAQLQQQRHANSKPAQDDEDEDGENSRASVGTYLV